MSTTTLSAIDLVVVAVKQYITNRLEKKNTGKKTKGN